MSAINIDEVDVLLPGEAKPRKVGLRSDFHTVYLYLLEDPDAFRPEDSLALLRLIKAIRDTYFADLRLDATDWRVRAGYFQSTIAVRTDAGPSSLCFDVSNILICHTPPGLITDYRNDVFHEADPLLNGRAPPRTPEAYCTQETPDGRTFLFKQPPSEVACLTEVVYVDSRKVRKLLEKYSPEQVMSDAEVRRTKQLGAWGDWTSGPQELMKLSCRRLGDGTQIFGITSGRADLMAAVLDSKAERFPVLVNKDEAPLLRQLCGMDRRHHKRGWIPRF